MPGAFTAADKLNQLAVAPDEEVGGHAQPGKGSIVRMGCGVEAIGEQLDNPLTAKPPWGQTDVVYHQQINDGFCRTLIEIRRGDQARFRDPALGADIHGTRRTRIPVSAPPPVTSVDAKPLHPVTHGPKGDAEEFRGCGPIESGFLKRFQNGLFLHPIQIILQRPFAVAAYR